LAGNGLESLNVLIYNSVIYHLFDAFVADTLSYGYEIWGFATLNEIERI
jgi:hypothetical protein